MHPETTTSTNITGRSDADLHQWGAEILTRWGLQHEFGCHLIEWAHDDGCPQHPNHGGRPGSRCWCRPDGTLVLHIGMPQERRVEVVRDGIALPVRRRGVATR